MPQVHQGVAAGGKGGTESSMPYFARRAGGQEELHSAAFSTVTLK